MSVREQSQKVIAKASEWAAKPYSDKLALLHKIRANLEKYKQEWVDASIAQRNYGGKENKMGHMQAEMYLVGPALLGFHVKSLIETYTALAATGGPPPALSTRTVNGQTVVKNWPVTVMDKVFAGGMMTETWLEPGQELAFDLPNEQPAGVTTVLAAGNFDGPSDVLTSLFVTNHVVLFKSNPVNAKTQPVIQKVMAPLLDAGFLACFSGDYRVGQELLSYAESNEVCITGSHHTVNRIVWGAPEEQAANMAADNKLLDKKVTAELGSVNPVLVVPGVWTTKQIDHHAENIVSAKMANGSHICASPQVIFTDANWPQRDLLLERIRHYLSIYPGVRSYYPGSKEAWARHRAHVDDADVIAAPELEKDQVDRVDRIFKTGIADGHYALQNEAFAAVLTEYPVTMEEGATPLQFLNKAIDLANEKCWGTLTGNVVMQDAFVKQNYDDVNTALQGFKVGCIGVNVWAGFGAMHGQLPWGGFPGHTLKDVQSGIGKTGSYTLVSKPERSVMWAPFEYLAAGKVPKNPEAPLKLNKRVADYFITPGVWNLVKLLSAATTGV